MVWLLSLDFGMDECWTSWRPCSFTATSLYGEDVGCKTKITCTFIPMCTYHTPQKKLTPKSLTQQIGEVYIYFPFLSSSFVTPSTPFCHMSRTTCALDFPYLKAKSSSVSSEEWTKSSKSLPSDLNGICRFCRSKIQFIPVFRSTNVKNMYRSSET